MLDTDNDGSSGSSSPDGPLYTPTSFAPLPPPPELLLQSSQCDLQLPAPRSCRGLFTTNLRGSSPLIMPRRHGTGSLERTASLGGPTVGPTVTENTISTPEATSTRRGSPTDLPEGHCTDAGQPPACSTAAPGFQRRGSHRLRRPGAASHRHGRRHTSDGGGTPVLRYGTAACARGVCASPTASSRDWVRLNVGGRIFTTTLATLRSDPDSVLAQICETLLEAQPPPPPPSQCPTVSTGGTKERHSTVRGPTDGECSSVVGTCGDANPANPTSCPADDTFSIADGGHPGWTSVVGRAMHRDPAKSSGLGDGREGHSNGASPNASGAGGDVPSPQRETVTVTLDVDHHHSILLDLDPDYFGPVLNYLRHRMVVIPPHLSPKGVLAVAEYLNVQGMVRQLAPERRIRRQMLFSWGSGGSGELGTQAFRDNDVPTPVQVSPFGTKVVQVALGANYSCALTDDGNVYTFGNGDWGQLGLGNPRHLDVHPSDQSAVVSVPRRIPLFEEHRALYVSAGYAFAMAITEDYHVYFWGNNNHGQSGLGPLLFDYNLKKIDEPRLVETLEGKRIVQLGCGSFFSLALSEDGTLYSWGLVECLGLGSPDEVRARYGGTSLLSESLSNEKRLVVLVPQPVSTSTPHRIVRVHAGQWHSGAINSKGELFTWGVGYQGRLGHGSKEPAYYPRQVRGALVGQHVVDVACGSFHTVCLTDRGAVFCWGDNASGQCGASASRTEAVTSPYRVVGLEFIAGGIARRISCGRQHTVVVMDGPQPGCTLWCCQLDYRGCPHASHAQVYSFGESIRAGCGAGGNPAAPTTPQNTSGGARHGLAMAPGRSGRPSVDNGVVTQQSVLPSGFVTAAALDGAVHHQYQLIPGLELLDVRGVVSGLHHTFVYAEKLEPCAGSSASPLHHRVPATAMPPPARHFYSREETDDGWSDGG